MNSRALVIGAMLVVLGTTTSKPIGEPENHGCPSKKCFSQDCGEILQNDPSAESGDYLIQPSDGRPEFTVYCEMREDGGWTVIQRREDGLVNFYRNWADYKEGFGNVHSEFWLGNEQINRITSDGDFELLVEITDHTNAMKNARYSHFRIGTEWSNYTLRISGYTGSAGDSMAYHKDRPFSTYDRDNDGTSSKNCAENSQAGWWFNNCYHSSLNGPYLTPGTIAAANYDKGILWHHFKGTKYSHKITLMMVKRAPKGEL
ncbi:fibrinogen-like protein 1 [Antedon mediterranea]|uniref:fibrinogen-like protein 1 n=1 Tax=Antedon mediterranea TaxID=105859 RepID=UPI003AF5D5DE